MDPARGLKKDQSLKANDLFNLTSNVLLSNKNNSTILKNNKIKPITMEFLVEKELKFKPSNPSLPKKNHYYNKDITLRLKTKDKNTKEKHNFTTMYVYMEYNSLGNLITKWKMNSFYKITFDLFIKTCGISLSFLDERDQIFLRKVFLQKVQPVFNPPRIPFQMNYSDQSLAEYLKLGFDAYFHYFNPFNPLFSRYEFFNAPRSQLLKLCIYLTGLRCLPRTTQCDFLISKIESEVETMLTFSKLKHSLDTVQAIFAFIMVVKWAAFNPKHYGLFRTAFIMLKGFGKKPESENSLTLLHNKELELAIRLSNYLDTLTFSQGTYYLPNNYMEGYPRLQISHQATKSMNEYCDKIPETSSLLYKPKTDGFLNIVENYIHLIITYFRDQSFIILKEMTFIIETNNRIYFKSYYKKVLKSCFKVKCLYYKGNMKLQDLYNFIHDLDTEVKPNQILKKRIFDLVQYMAQAKTIMGIWFHFINLKLLDCKEKNASSIEFFNNENSASLSYSKFIHAERLIFLINKVHSLGSFVFHRAYLLFFSSRFVAHHISLSRTLNLNIQHQNPFPSLRETRRALIELKRNEFYVHPATSFLDQFDSMMIRFHLTIDQ